MRLDGDSQIRQQLIVMFGNYFCVIDSVNKQRLQAQLYVANRP